MKTDKKYDFAKFKEEIAYFESASLLSEGKQHKYQQSEMKQTTKYIELFPFDPNHLSKDKWRKLGLNDGQINSIYKYESKGGHFKTKEDVKKMYVIDDSIYQRLKPYIHIKREAIKEGTRDRNELMVNKTKIKYSELHIEINRADTSELMKLKGIGSSYSKRIISYRNMLGGYATTTQLKEVYGFTGELYDKIKPYIKVDTSLIKKININNCTVSELKSHPYIKYNVANSIVAYRNKHGKYQSVEGIKSSDLVDDRLYYKIAPYLKLE